MRHYMILLLTVMSLKSVHASDCSDTSIKATLQMAYGGNSDYLGIGSPVIVKNLKGQIMIKGHFIGVRKNRDSSLSDSLWVYDPVEHIMATIPLNVLKVVDAKIANGSTVIEIPKQKKKDCGAWAYAGCLTQRKLYAEEKSGEFRELTSINEIKSNIETLYEFVILDLYQHRPIKSTYAEWVKKQLNKIGIFARNTNSSIKLLEHLKGGGTAILEFPIAPSTTWAPLVSVDVQTGAITTRAAGLAPRKGHETHAVFAYGAFSSGGKSYILVLDSWTGELAVWEQSLIGTKFNNLKNAILVHE